MKKILFFCLIFLFLIATRVGAQTVTPSKAITPTPTDTNSLDQQINDLKDRIASRVAQLQLVEKRGIVGTVTDISDTQITLSDLQGNIRFVDVDELTKFSSPSAKTNFGISDITKGSTLGVLGLYNKQSHRILARFVDVLSLPTVVSGAVSAIDDKNFIFTLSTANKQDYTINVGSETKTYAYDASTGLTRSGFSKLKVGERIMVVGFPDVKDKNTIIPSRVLRFPTVPVNPKIIIINPDELNVTPSTGSGTKLVPIIKVK